MYLFLSIIAISVVIAPSISASQKCEEKRYKVVCYLASWSVYRDGNGAFKFGDIVPTYCTHLVYTFAGLNLAGGVDSLDYYNDINVNKGYEKIIELKEENPCLKIMLAVGGWNEGSEKYSLMAETEETRNIFADSALRFLAHFGFDGLDVDWEYPTMRGGIPEDRENFVLLLETLRAKLEHRKKLLTIAISGSTLAIEAGYNMSAICGILDFVNLMGYDYRLNHTASVDAALYTDNYAKTETVDNAISYIRKTGCPLNKIILGIPTMAKTFTLKPGVPSNTLSGKAVIGPGRAGPFTKNAGALGYNELCEMIKEGKWSTILLRNVGVNVAVQGDQWVTYDDGESVKLKAKYAMDKGLGGVMFWTIDTDDFRGDCHNKAYPMILAANQVFGYVVQ